MSESESIRRSVRVRLEDRPGSLASVAQCIAEADGNIVRFEVASREDGQAWDDFEIEATSATHLGLIVRALRAQGHEVIGLPPGWSIREWAFDVVASLAAIAGMDDPEAIRRHLLDALNGVAGTDQGVILLDDPHADTAAATARWESIEQMRRAIDPDAVRWTGDREAIEAARLALRSDHQAPIPGSHRGRVGGVALLLGNTPRSGIVILAGGRPPLLPAEDQRVRSFAEIIRIWLRTSQVATT